MNTRQKNKYHEYLTGCRFPHKEHYSSCRAGFSCRNRPHVTRVQRWLCMDAIFVKFCSFAYRTLWHSIHCSNLPNSWQGVHRQNIKNFSLSQFIDNSISLLFSVCNWARLQKLWNKFYNGVMTYIHSGMSFVNYWWFPLLCTNHQNKR